MGPPLEGTTQLGPLMTAGRVSDLVEHVKNAQKQGAKVVCGGEKVMDDGLERGNYFPPTIVTGVTPDMSVAQEELFGPVLCVITYDDLDEAIEVANDSEFGLAAYVWSNDIRKSNHIANRLESGNVFINSYGYQSEIPFGGYKMSGIGREHGAEAIHEYTQTKSITVGMERFQSRFDI